MLARRTGRDPASRLLAWYDRHRRTLPWRAAPGERPDPYRVWLSEVMLQQTTVAAVAPYYLRFLERWPTLQALAAAPGAEVMAAWAGLGYYSRARNLIACARAVAAAGGRFPEDQAALRALPGIGPYTAGAIAAIAFDAPEVAVDGNVERVLTRYRAIQAPLPQAKPQIAAEARALLPKDRPGDFAQALMDLGAAVCTPKKPLCALCPWTDDCAGRRAGIAETLPRKAAKGVPPQRYGAAFVAVADGAVLLRRRPSRGLLGGMMEPPQSPWEAAMPSDPLAHAPFAWDWRALDGAVRHGFTHFRLEVRVFRADTRRRAVEDAEWTVVERLPHAGLPSVMRKIVGHALRAEG